MTPEVLVVGSLNLDLVVPVERLPGRGETVLGGDRLQAAGGKGANQAVAAARLGRRTALVGRVGADDAGRLLREALRAAGVDDALVLEDATAPSGLALIPVERGGENLIVVSPGANARLDGSDVERAREALAAAAVVLLQLEVPLAAVGAAAAAAAGTVVLNPAPGRALPADLLVHVDVLVPNRTELGLLLDAPAPEDAHHAIALAQQLAEGRAVVVTLGVEGAVAVADGGHAERIPALAVEAVDATGAGDAFCGALGDALARGAELVEAARWAAAAAAISVTREGAQGGMPTAEEVEAAWRSA